MQLPAVGHESGQSHGNAKSVHNEHKRYKTSMTYFPFLHPFMLVQYIKLAVFLNSKKANKLLIVVTHTYSILLHFQWWHNFLSGLAEQSGRDLATNGSSYPVDGSRCRYRRPDYSLSCTTKYIRSELTVCNFKKEKFAISVHKYLHFLYLYHCNI